MMKKLAMWVVVGLGSVLGVVDSAQAVEFAVVGARAAGMGGAGVAVTTDAYATYWNPAGLAMTKTAEIRIQGTVQAIDRLGIKDTFDDLKNFDTTDTSPANVTRANSIRDRFNQPGASVSAIAAGGLYIKGYYGDHAFGFNISDVATAGSFTSVPVTVATGATVSIAGQLQLNGLEARQAVASYAYAFADRTVSIGVSGKLIQGAAYTGTADISGGTDIKLSDNFGQAKLTTAFGIDVGVMYRPSSWLRLGVVAKDINKPSFNTPLGGQFKLDPQVRGGVAVNPWQTLTVTADLDVLSNRTLTPGIKSQVLSVGAEQTVFSELVSFRIGAYKNTADANSYITPTAGLGLRFWALRADLGGGYDFHQRGALASGAVSMVF